jgi:mRNA interferase RelE/StbE
LASYKLEISATAERQLRKLPARDIRRVVEAIEALVSNPRPSGCRKLTGYRDVLRIRVGTYRVLYSIDDERIIVIILKIGHRRDVYR